MVNKFWKWVKKSWHFIWYDDSLLAWLLNVALAFVVIKFLLYPGVGLIFDTDLPIVAVVSGSMEHKVVNTCVRQEPTGKCAEKRPQICGEIADKARSLTLEEFWEYCGAWYDDIGVTQEQFATFPFKNGFNKGDIMLIRGSEPENLEVGDVLVFDSRQSYPIIHRIVEIHETEEGLLFSTKGDHNERQIVKYAIPSGQFAYECYQEIDAGIFPSLCGPGVPEVTEDVPNAIRIIDEATTTEEQIIGKAYGRVPYLGYVKIWFTDLLVLLGLMQPAKLI